MKFSLSRVMYQTMITIQAPNERVFDLFSDPTEWRNWMDGIKRVYRVEGEAQSPGCVTKIVMEADQKKVNLTQELMERDRPKKLVMVVSYPGYECHFNIQFVKQGGRTKIICDNLIRWKALRYAVFGWFIGVLMRQNQQREWARFQMYCESN